ncbi:MAG: pyridoxamine 5'-phosphate oxidase family protein [Anaerolineae bacterium]|jgi:hypothetical protein|nr:pyridoxamine 5'-phosphate oxidase family protein [Chloroflexota bacterium]MBV6435326.1 hypothetical protein [Anaerolineae bacterium]MDL1917300.1 pyridoxamine 5'-phosphate oxidase family protein [Anaerolineae bacterium CFX4]OQY84807.1 MAG: pyridoxamine 5'-phosphate oxidase [Anaerolineae bacterium UTCFX5]MCO6445886.1 pyridoxamine 5'-phosphate oxidase family protein [Anaerolineae bacterium]
MSKFFDSITDELRRFIAKQHVFFVATAPLADDGHVNLSPKGLDSFRVLSPHQVAYLDMTGSGNETSAHLAENGRITFMFCAFDGPPDIVRLYGTGRTILPGTPAWDALAPQFTLFTGVRQIIVADIHKAQTSCGYAVPYFDYVGQRDTLIKYWEVKGDAYKAEYQANKNASSIDGLPTPLSESITE